MPQIIYETVMRDNLQLVHRQHFLDREYFATVRTIVESKWDHLRSSRKSRRTDGASGSGTGSGRTATAAASMSIDTATHPDAASAAGAAAGAADAAAAGGAAGPGPGAAQPLSRRNGEVTRAKVVSVQLATEFLMKVYWQAHPSLRTDAPQWEEAIGSLTALPAAAKAFLETLQRYPHLLQAFYLACPSSAVRVFLSHTTGTCLATMFRTQQQMVGEDEDPTYHAAMNAIWRELHGMLNTLATEPHHEPEAVLNALLSFCRAGQPVTGALLLTDEVMQLLVTIVDRTHPNSQHDDMFVEEMLLAYRLMYCIVASHVEQQARPPDGDITPQMYSTAHRYILRRLEANSLFAKSFSTGFGHAWMRLDHEAFRLGALLAHNNEFLTAHLLASCMDLVGQAPADEDLCAQMHLLASWLCAPLLPDDRLARKRLHYLLGGIPNIGEGLLGVVQLRHTPKRRLQLLDVLRRVYMDEAMRAHLVAELERGADYRGVLQRVQAWLQQSAAEIRSQGLSEMANQLSQLLEALLFPGGE